MEYSVRSAVTSTGSPEDAACSSAVVSSTTFAFAAAAVDCAAAVAGNIGSADSTNEAATPPSKTPRVLRARRTNTDPTPRITEPTLRHKFHTESTELMQSH
ncbi:hypothetical protein GCM10023097_77500 [Streptomyces collinus]